ncbi:MAG TPA: YbaK/EbsC family protein [Gaiellaceae bacterium]|nr:YbaK/EbsC family protein [Gaiellaceae bacterium]
MTSAELARKLAEQHTTYRLLRHPHTERATDEAAALGLPPEEIGKTLVLAHDDRFLRAVLPASERLDLRKLRALPSVGAAVRLASEAEIGARYSMFELGAVPPFGGPDGDAVVVDRRIAERDSVIVEAGSHEESIQMTVRDLLALTGAQVADICLD